MFKPRLKCLPAGRVGFEQKKAPRRTGRAKLDEYRLEQQIAGQAVLPVPAEHDRDGGHAGERSNLSATRCAASNVRDRGLGLPTTVTLTCGSIPARAVHGIEPATGPARLAAGPARPR